MNVLFGVFGISTYLLAPALGNPWVPLAIGAALVTGQVFLLNRVSRRRAGEAV